MEGREKERYLEGVGRGEVRGVCVGGRGRGRRKGETPLTELLAFVMYVKCAQIKCNLCLMNRLTAKGQGLKKVELV